MRTSEPANDPGSDSWVVTSFADSTAKVPGYQQQFECQIETGAGPHVAWKRISGYFRRSLEKHTVPLVGELDDECIVAAKPPAAVVAAFLDSVDVSVSALSSFSGPRCKAVRDSPAL